MAETYVENPLKHGVSTKVWSNHEGGSVRNEKYSSPKATEPQAADSSQPQEPRARASKVEYKTVDEIWDNATSKYKIVESSTVPSEVDAYDEYIFVVRIHIGN